jgi:hypothetical protein
MRGVEKEFQLRVNDPKVQAFLANSVQAFLSLPEAKLQMQGGILNMRVVLQHSIAGTRSSRRLLT